MDQLGAYLSPEEDPEEEEDTSGTPESATSPPPLPTSGAAEQLRSLGIVEEDIARVLRLASTAVSLLTLPVPAAEDEVVSKEEALAGNSEEREEKFAEAIEEYFFKLQRIHTTIRNALSDMRAARVSPALLMESTGKEPPTYGVSLPQGGGGGAVPEKAEERLGLYEKRLMRGAWAKLADAMEMLRKAREEASTPQEEGGSEANEHPP